MMDCNSDTRSGSRLEPAPPLVAGANRSCSSESDISRYNNSFGWCCGCKLLLSFEVGDALKTRSGFRVKWCAG